MNFSQLPVTPVIINSRLVPFANSPVFETQRNFGAAGWVLPVGSGEVPVMYGLSDPT
jgi:hypothetical protein